MNKTIECWVNKNLAKVFNNPRASMCIANYDLWTGDKGVKVKLIIELPEKKKLFSESEFDQLCINLSGIETTTMKERENIAEAERQRIFGN